MLAVIKTGGKQYAVKAGQILKVEKLDGKKGDSVSFDNVLAVTDSSSHTFGNPLIKGASVEAKILYQIRDKKIIVFKKRRRKNSKSTQGHRQYITVLKIESIMSSGKKSIALKKAIKVKGLWKINHLFSACQFTISLTCKLPHTITIKRKVNPIGIS